MSLQLASRIQNLCHYELHGDVVFDNAAMIEREGSLLLLNSPEGCSHWEINLRAVEHADSSALSVCLSWIRLAKKKGVTLCFTEISLEVEALAEVCGIRDLLVNLQCMTV